MDKCKPLHDGKDVDAAAVAAAAVDARDAAAAAPFAAGAYIRPLFGST